MPLTVYVRELFLHGFKSFADPARIRFARGLTVVIGPNGSGKSNLVDALAFVLATSGGGPRELRVERLDELLFQGGGRRAAARRAVVELTLEHDGELGVPGREATVARRIDAGGASDYVLNGEVVRQRDVAPMWRRLGLGEGAAAVIGQGDVEAVLEAGPAELRRLVEDAGGLGPYREARRNALAELAKAEGALAVRRRELELIEAELAPLEAEVERLVRAEGLRRELYRLEVAGLRQRRAERRRVAEEEAARAEAAARRLREVGAAQERLAALQEDLWQTGAALRLRQGELQEALRRAAEEGRAQRGARDEIRRLEVLAAEEERRLPELARARAASEAELERIRRDLAAAEEEAATGPPPSADLPERRQELDALLAELAARREGLARRSAEVEADLARLLRRRREQEAEERLALTALGQAEGELARLTREAARPGQGATGGVRPAARAVVEAAARGTLQGVVGLLGDLVVAPPGLALAVEVALGGLYDAVVVEEEVHAASAIAFLRRHRIGVATFLPLASLRPPPLRDPPAGSLGWLAQRIDAEAAAVRAKDAVLGNVLLVQDLPTAFHLRRRLAAPPRMVTPAGEMLFPLGSVRGGFAARRSGGDRRAPAEERRRLEAEVAARRRAVAACRSAAVALEEELERRRRERAACDAEREELEARLKRLAEARDDFEALRARREAARAALRLRGRLEAEEAELARRREEEARAAARLAELSRALAEAQAAVREPSGGDEEAAARLGARLRAAARLEAALARLGRLLDEAARQVARAEAELAAEEGEARAAAGRAAAEVEALSRRLVEEFGAEVDGEARPVGEEVLHALRRQLAELGPVRPEAETALAAVRRRRADAQALLDDVLATKERLLRTMARADEVLEGRFGVLLEEVDRSFRALVAALFPGGWGGLKRTGEGIGIELLLPGKRVRRLALFSGGERTLVALALLFALAERRPSPIQILDEADASLDEANLERFLDLVRRRGRQVLLISHQRPTMEAAHLLVGVTMQEPGVTSVVEVEIADGVEGALAAVEGRPRSDA